MELALYASYMEYCSGIALEYFDYNETHFLWILLGILIDRNKTLAYGMEVTQLALDFKNAIFMKLSFLHQRHHPIFGFFSVQLLNSYLISVWVSAKSFTYVILYDSEG